MPFMPSRKTIKRLLPAAVKAPLERLRTILNGPGIAHDVLHDTGFAPDPDPRPRLTLLMPDLAADKAFGGVMTALALAADLARRLAPHGIGLRIVSEAPLPAGGNVLDQVPGLAGAEVVSLARSGQVLALRAREICLVYNCWLSVNLTPALAAQAAHFGRPVLPRIHLVQDYEPQFFPFSAMHLVAHRAMGLGDGLWAVFNTRELHDYWRRQGHRAGRTFVFEPRLNARLRPFAGGITAADKRPVLLVYGRPAIRRNAFFLIERGLKAWAARHGADHPDWDLVSAGLAHDDVDLGGGRRLRSLGRLSLEDYAGLLRRTSVGLSLMVSPHPSYPPLEMAHFGARVLTNGYTDKDPARRHENLVVLPDIDASAMAEAIEREIRGVIADPGKGLAARSFMPDFLGPEGFDCAAELAEAIREALAGDAPGPQAPPG